MIVPRAAFVTSLCVAAVVAVMPMSAAAAISHADCAVAVNGECRMCCVKNRAVTIEARAFKWWVPNPLSAFSSVQLRLTPVTAETRRTCVFPPTSCKEAAGAGASLAGASAAKAGRHSNPKAREWVQRHLPLVAVAHLAGDVSTGTVFAPDAEVEGALAAEISPVWGTTTLAVRFTNTKGSTSSGPVAVQLVSCAFVGAGGGGGGGGG